LSIGSAFFVPAGAQWDFKIPEVDYLFTHATFSGAKAENGQLMTGVDSSVLSGFAGKCYSGDIHVPQVMAGGKIEYVGAPYHIRFGDAFVPRVLCIENSGKTRDLHFPAPSKHTFIIARPDDLRDEEAKAGDHVKVRCLLRRSEYDKWRGYAAEIKRIAEERSWLLFGAEPVALEMSEQARAEAEDGRALSTDDVLAAYVRQQKAGDDYLVAGRLLLSGG